MADAPRTVPLPPRSNLSMTGAPTQLPETRSRRKEIDRRESDQSPAVAGERRSGEQRRQALAASQPVEDEKERKRKELQRIAEERAMKLAQHRRKRLLASCEPITSLNYDLLAMDNYPENTLLAQARQDRDLWLFVCSVLGLVFLLGLMGLINGWIAGSALGLSILAAIFAFSPLRTVFFERPTLGQLLQQRKELEFRALAHIRFLESHGGLMWRCREMASYNPNLGRKLFAGLVNFSANGTLIDMLRSRQHIRLYLLYGIEAQKAYQKLEKTYLENHFRNLEQGMDDRISDDEADSLQQQEEAAANP